MDGAGGVLVVPHDLPLPVDAGCHGVIASRRIVQGGVCGIAQDEAVNA